jgi:uncharacterized SAM-binding protein YcdF (DUF218 family)
MHLAAQVLPQLVLPVGLTLLLALAGLALRRRWLVLLALALLWVASSGLTASALWRVVEAGQERVLASNAPQTDAIVVLSSRRRTAPGETGVRGWSTAERFLGGRELIAAERAPWLVFTGGWSPRSPDAAPEGDVNRLDAIALGVAPERILTTGPVRNTAEEAEAVAALLRQPGIGDADAAEGAAPHVLLVTSAYHMPRAALLFEGAGLRVTPFPVDFRQDTARRFTLVDLVPSARALAETETALRELYGRVVYRVGW